MRVIDGGNYSHPRPGTVKTLKAGLPGPWAFLGGPEYVATKADAAKWGLTEGKAYRDWTCPGYPLVIDGDTEFRGTNFAQESPHTEIFSVVAAPGSLVNPVLRFVDCNLVNVRVPDGAEIVGGNLAHVVPTETGDKDRPIVSLLHECEKCASAWRELNDAIEAGDLPKDASGRILHHEMKGRYAARREFEGLVEADIEDVRASNDKRMEKFPGGR